jgi:MoaA/NifB/PqqE/SkfB family radical SAM enzyme
MQWPHYLKLSLFGLGTLAFGWKKPILGTIILGDRCNLHCSHCAVNNIHSSMAPYEQVRSEMLELYQMGIRLLFFCGGETTLWRDSGKDLHDLISEAKAIGFYSIQIVTNGTLSTDYPEADLVFLSLDGRKEAHDRIRGEGTWDKVSANLKKNTRRNIVVYAAINNTNLGEIRALGDMVRDHPALSCISFNFHTPFPGTERLSLSQGQKVEAVEAIRGLMREGYPVFNLETGLDHWLRGDWRRPCHQCVVIENGRIFTCGRCVGISGLCQECGFLFATDFSLLFAGNLKAIAQMAKTYPRYA